MEFRRIRALWVLITLSAIVWVSYKSDVILQERDGTYFFREQVDTFAIEKLDSYLDELNMPYKRVVIAQARLETGQFKSLVFKNHHNLFGMKRASVRPTTSVGVADGHATYNTWRESVVDYALWYARYASACKSEAEYLKYLGSVYAEDEYYIVKLKKLIY